MRRAPIVTLAVLVAVAAWWLLRPAAPDTVPAAAGEERAGTTATVESGLDHGAGPGGVATDDRRAVAAPGASRGTGSLRVLVVTGPGATPLPHVAVTATARDGRDEESSRRVAVTASDGRAGFAALAAGPWRLHTDRAVDGSAPVECAIVAGAESAVTIRVAPGVDAVVRVLDAAGGRVPGAEVLHWAASGTLDVPAWRIGEVVGTTGADGSLALAALPHLQGHGCWVAARHPAHGRSAARMVRSPAEDDDVETRSIELVLRAAGTYLDVVVLTERREPVGGAAVTVRPLDHASSAGDGATRVLAQTCLRAAAGADGRAALGPLAAGEYLLRVLAAGRARFQQPIRVDGAGRVSRDVVLTAAARARGVVRDAAGSPVGGVRVQVRVESGGGSAETGADGAFSIDRLGAGDGSWTAHHEDFAPAGGPVALRAGEGHELAIALERLPRLHGVVVDEDGVPLAEWTVVVERAGDDHGRRLATDFRGVFDLAVPGGDEHSLAVHEPGQVWPAVVAARTHARDEPWLVRVPDAARATAFVAGRLVDAAGEPAIAGRSLSAQRAGARRAWLGITAPAPDVEPASGRFRIGPLPGGEYTLWIARPDRLEFSVEAVLHPEQTTELGTIREPAAGTVSAELTAEPGLDPRTVLVELEPEGGGEAGILRVDPSSLTGRRALLPGRYRATVYGSGFRSVHTVVAVVANETAVLRASLRPAVRVGLRFLAPDGEDGAAFVVRDARGELAFAVELDAGTRSETWWPWLDRGRFDVRARATSGRAYFGAFTVESLERRTEPIDVRVEPVR